MLLSRARDRFLTTASKPDITDIIEYTNNLLKAHSLVDVIKSRKKEPLSGIRCYSLIMYYAKVILEIINLFLKYNETSLLLKKFGL